MSETFRFAPTPRDVFQFQTELDGDTYITTITWNVYRVGWYLNVFTLTGDIILSRALVASPPGYPISLTAGYFATPLVYYATTNLFVVGT